MADPPITDDMGYDDHPGAAGVYDFEQEMAEPRKRYGTTPLPNFATGARQLTNPGMTSVGDPIFVTDGQNNDEFYTYDSDVPRDVDDTSQPYYEPEDLTP